VLTQAPLTPPSVERATYDAVFGDAGFASALLVPAAELAVRAWAAEAGGDDNPDAAAALAAIVVDVGFSATTAAAVFDGRLLPATVARVDLGGKAMTNLLKDAISLRHVDVRGEGAAVAVMKDAAAFVSLDLAADLAAAKRGERTVEWVLPDGVANLKGYARTGLPPSHPAAAPPSTAPGAAAAPTAKQTIVPLSVERFMIPEAWFHPSDAGLDQGGAPAAVARALAAAHPRLRPLLASNVLVVGAGAACPGFGERLAAETAPLVDGELDLRVRVVRDPATAAWRGGRLLAGSPEYGRRAVGRGAWEARGGRR
jgi:actin-related protein 6